MLRSVDEICQIGLAPAARQFWKNFQTLLVLLIPNCTPYRMITYTKSDTNRRQFAKRVVLVSFSKTPNSNFEKLTVHVFF